CYERLAQNAKEKLKRTGYTNITVITGDGSEGLKEHAPYDRISVAAAAPEIPQPLIDQLKRGGRMVIPISTRHHQELYLVTKNHKTRIERKGGVAFVPLTGKYGIESKHKL
ncbi:protein-L-isoaspartate O-methyltransferase, partial [Methanosarcinales archaeon]